MSRADADDSECDNACAFCYIEAGTDFAVTCTKCKRTLHKVCCGLFGTAVVNNADFLCSRCDRGGDESHVYGIENEQFMCYLISLFGAFQAIPYGSFTGVRVLNEALDYWRANKEPIPRAVLSNWLTNLPLCDDYPPYFDRFPRNEQQDPDEAMLYLISASIPFETMSNALKFTIFEYRSLVCGHSTRPQQIDEVVVKMGIPDRLPFVSFQELLYNFENSVGDIMECETCGKRCVYTSHIQFSELKDYLFVKFKRERVHYLRNNTKIMGISEGISILCNNILMKYDPVAVIDHIPALGRENLDTPSRHRALLGRSQSSSVHLRSGSSRHD
jgi:hypothetical protein